MIPNKIKIGDKDYKIKVDQQIEINSGRLGEIDYRNVEITVTSGLETQMLKDVLVHEAVHGMLQFMGEHEVNREETVERITGGLLMLIKGNPDLFK